ncbi:hypothetical protein DOY81_000333 [Sarcophaga bullata]|nr:hypothetical protein DOY81_000333 [Sarcophaga bullata]
MAVLVSHTIRQKKLIYFLVVAVFAFMLIKNVEATTNADDGSNRNKEDNNKTPFEKHTQLEQQKTFKKELKVNLSDLNLEPITEPIEDDNHTEKLIVIDENSVIETESKAIVQPISPQNQTPVAVKVKEEETSRPPTAIPTKLSTTAIAKPKHHEEEKYLTNGEGDISDSLKTGFYFFLILSSGAVFFIMFKIYRLRLSRAERRYGVQGDRTTQELTPLPTSIEDGHSDDEDQTVFEVQRQNIRIL